MCSIRSSLLPGSTSYLVDSCLAFVFFISFSLSNSSYLCLLCSLGYFFRLVLQAMDSCGVEYLFSLTSSAILILQVASCVSCSPLDSLRLIFFLCTFPYVLTFYKTYVCGSSRTGIALCLSSFSPQVSWPSKHQTSEQKSCVSGLSGSWDTGTFTYPFPPSAGHASLHLLMFALLFWPPLRNW